MSQANQALATARMAQIKNVVAIGAEGVINQAFIFGFRIGVSWGGRVRRLW